MVGVEVVDMVGVGVEQVDGVDVEWHVCTVERQMS